MKQTKFLGIPVTVIESEAEFVNAKRGAKHVHMISPVKDHGTIDTCCPPALVRRRLRTPCEDCNEVCFYDPESVMDAANSFFLCVRCTLDRAKKNKKPH